MSTYTLLGLLGGLGLFALSILLATDNYGIFFNLPGLLLVMGGTLANAFISFKGRYVFWAVKDMGRVLLQDRLSPDVLFEETQRVVSWARLATAEGVLTLEKKLASDEADDQLLQTGIKMVVDGFQPQAIRDVLENLIESGHERAVVPVKILRNMASTSPAFGMVGTLVGLIIMLDSLGDDASNLGSGLAVALVTTLYGVFFARMMFQPAADKTLQRAEILRFRNLLMAESLIMLADGKRPKYIQIYVESMLDPTLVSKHGGGW